MKFHWKCIINALHAFEYLHYFEIIFCRQNILDQVQIFRIFAEFTT